MFQCPVKATFFSRRCRSGNCKVTCKASDFGIFFFTKQTCIVDDIGYLFLDDLLSSDPTTFKCFCEEKTRLYQTVHKKAKFMAPNTFADAFLAWASALKIDFREGRDPFCGNDPKHLICDGTHIGVQLRLLDVEPIEKNDTLDKVPYKHRRMDRVFLASKDSRLYLLNMAKSYLENVHFEKNDNSTITLERHCNSPDAWEFIKSFIERDFNPQLLRISADILSILAHDNPIVALLPFKHLNDIREANAKLRNNQGNINLADISPEIHDLLIHARCDAKKNIVCNFVDHLLDMVIEVFENDGPTTQVDEINNSYDPRKGLFYYFTESGNQLRRLPRYAMDDLGSSEVDSTCRRNVNEDRNAFVVNPSGYSSLFVWLCPDHGHVYGCHLIKQSEGRKDPFSSILKYKETAPDVIFYDFCCSLHEYCLNREPRHFRGVKFFHDAFHSYHHKCAKTYRGKRFESYRGINTSQAEQFNSYLARFRNMAVHLSQPRFMFLLQLMVHFWNKSKTKSFNDKLALVRQYQL